MALKKWGNASPEAMAYALEDYVEKLTAIAPGSGVSYVTSGRPAAGVLKIFTPQPDLRAALEKAGGWIKQHDCDIITAYFGYELQGPTPKGKWYCRIGENWTYPVPDFTSPDCAWTGQALELWLGMQEHRHMSLKQHSTSRRRFVWLYEPGAAEVTVGEGATINEAIAWALWEARGTENGPRQSD
jgi:hypothetical protein